MNKTIKPIKFFALSTALCAAMFMAPVSTAQAEEFTAEQKKELQVLFKNFINENPDVLLESVRMHQEKQAEQAMKNAQDKLSDYQDVFARDDMPVGGNPDGDVTVVEFFDYNCGYCKKAFDDIQKIIAEDNNVRVVFMEMPILSPSSSKMAALALAAHKQGKYFETHKALMDYRGSQSEEAFFKLAEGLGLDMEKMKVDVKSPDVQKAVDEAKEMAQALNIRGTPGFVVGDEVYPGYIGIEALRKAVNDARTKKQK